MLSQAQKDQILAKVIELCQKANVRVISVTYDVTGRNAGVYWPGQDRMGVNEYYAAQYFDSYLADTVPHEVAHHVDFVRNGDKPRTFPSGRRDMHGKYFKAIIKELGGIQGTYHSYSGRPAGAQRRWIYACDCEQNIDVSTTIHNRIQQGQQRRCNSCRVEFGKEEFIEELK